MAQKKKTTGRRRTTSSASRSKGRKTKAQMQKEYALKREVFLIASICVCILLLLCNFNKIGKVGGFFSSVMFGLFGLLAYIFPIVLLLFIWLKTANPRNNVITRKVVFGSIAFIDLGIIIDIINGICKTIPEKYNLVEFYKFYVENKKGGGIISGSLSFALVNLIGKAGAIIVFILVLIICLVFLTEKSLIDGVKDQSEKFIERSAENRKTRNEYLNEIAKKREEEERLKEERDAIKEQELLERDERRRQKSLSREQERLEKEQARELQREQKENDKILRKNKVVSGVTFDTVIDPNMPTSTLRSSVHDDIHEININGFDPLMDDSDISLPEEEIYIVEDEPKKVIDKIDEIPILGIGREDITEVSPSFDREEFVKPKIQRSKPSFEFEDEKENKEEKPYYEPEIVKPKDKNSAKPTGADMNAVAAMAENAINTPVREYKFPSIELLKKNSSNGARDSEQSIRETARKLTETLDIFGVKATVTDISQGPTVTRFELQPELGVKVSRIKGLSDDIKLSLAASDIRIEAPIPGKSAVGIEVPNKVNQAVLLRELIDTKEFKDSKSNLAFAIGKDIAGKTIVYDIDKFPHLLIAGATGSGKSVCINTLIMSIIYKANPDDVKLIMIDPKVVELSVYNGIPHLMIPVVTEAKKASAALNWAVAEMMERYKKFADLNVRDLEGYNEAVKNMEGELYKKLPQLVIIVDELADLMMVARNEVEDAICRLAQLARACGIHLIIATQRPSVDVITGLIKANMPSRIAFAVSSMVDSRTILDMGGAEELLGKGDMLFFPKGMKKPVRLQGGFVSDPEVNSVVDFLKKYNPVDNTQSQEMTSKIDNFTSSSSSSSASSDGSDSAEFDEYFMDAAHIIIESNKASIGMLQRKFRIGFNRAARIMDKLAEYGVVSEEEGTKPRRVLMNMEEFENFVEENGL